MADVKALVSKTKSVEFVKSFKGQHGEIFVFDITMENGDTGRFSTTKREQTKFPIGQEAKYSKTPIHDRDRKTFRWIW